MRRRVWWTVLWVGAGSAGCAGDSNVCAERLESVHHADGSAYRCVRPEECPRTTNVFVCTTDALPETECVSCTQATCVRHVPVPCR